MRLKPVLVFDLVGTLLDLSALDSGFEREFGDRRARNEWFSEVCQLFLTSIAVNAYSDFTKVTEAALKIIEQRSGRILGPQERSGLLGELKQLPPFPDVKDGLERLHLAGFKLVVLSNSGLRAVRAMLEHATLADYFDETLSADSVKRFKPAAEPYQMAARQLGVSTGSLMLVAAHSWDIAGAGQAGLQTCFVRRPGQVLDEITPQPTLVVSGLRELPGRLSGLIAA